MTNLICKPATTKDANAMARISMEPMFHSLQRRLVCCDGSYDTTETKMFRQRLRQDYITDISMERGLPYALAALEEPHVNDLLAAAEKAQQTVYLFYDSTATPVGFLLPEKRTWGREWPSFFVPNAADRKDVQYYKKALDL